MSASNLDTATVADVLMETLARLGRIPDSDFSVRQIAIGDVVFTLRFGDQQLASLYGGRLVSGTRAVRAAAPSQTFRIDIVETERLGWPALVWNEPGWQRHLFDAALARRGLRAEYPYQEGCWAVLDRGGARGVQLCRSSRDLPPWHAGAPLRMPLHFALQQRRRRMVHAATLGVGGEGVLLVGEGGAGKSGTTLAGIANGMTTTGDDYVLIDQRNEPHAQAIYRVVKQDATGIARITGLMQRLGNLQPNWQGKYEFDPDLVCPGALSPSLRIRAVVAPVVSHADRSFLIPIRPAETAPLIVRSTLDLLPGDDAASIMQLTGLVAHLPCYRLCLSEDPAEIADTLRRLIAALSA